MKNKIFKFILLFVFCFVFLNANGQEQFNFDVTEIQILDDGNKFVGKQRGKISSDNGLVINANEFEYIKSLNLLTAYGNIEILDTINNYKIYTDKITYEKNNDKIYTQNGSRALDLFGGIEIIAEEFNYDISKNVITAKKNAIINNTVKNYTISSKLISYLKKENKIFTKGKTSAILNSKYNFKSSDVTFLINEKKLFSKNEAIVTDKSNFYKLENFVYFIDEEELKGEKILINSKYKLPTSDKFYFTSAIINLKKQTFLGADAKIKVRKDIFDDTDNDPRIIGISALSKNNKTKINKAVFTSCNENKKCAPWSIKAKEIIHDRDKKEIIYNSALLRIYDFPVLYFPKFFHPDPTVTRRSGFLQPQINNSNILGNSFSIPYYSVLSENKDFTFTPYIFENNLQMFQNEYRQINKFSKVYANFGLVNDYKSSFDTKENSIFNLFANYNLDLNLENFSSSNLFLKIEKVTNDTFLKVFDTHIQDSILKPLDYDNLKSEVRISLKNDKYSFESGIKSFENLQKRNNDRYEYILPYYSYKTSLIDDFFGGSINLRSNGDNILNNTNELKSKITNDIGFTSKEYLLFNGIKNTLGLNLKNLNSVGKKNSEYKSSPQIELMSNLSLLSSYPLLKQSENNINYLTPKILFKINPSDMKSYADADRTINVNNIFSNNRLGIDDTLESGKSITLGLDYKKENLNNLNKFFEFKIASVLRDREENFIPSKTTLNKKNSNVFGSITNNFSDFFNINYKFALENNLNTFEYNDFSAEFTSNNFVTKFNFLEETGAMGNSNFIENDTSIILNQQNQITFKTRRNRKLNLTEYYDLVYEYKNDCLAAGIKYKKTYYEDRDLKPSENLFFTISLIPLTSYEQKIDQ